MIEISDSVITVETLGKKYSLRHQTGERYTALRDVLTHKARMLFRSNGFAFTRRSQASSREDFWALKDVSFEVKQGEVVGIIGRNGAGKSTLLKILSRITEPTTGKIRIKGRVASLLEVGTGFHPELTGRENIFLNGAILGMTRSEIRKKFDEIVVFAEVEKFLDTPVKRYSSGMYVRLAFAVAAHMEPEILIVDEVLAVGDAEFQKKCLGKMEDVADREGRTVLFVSHNMATVEALCQRTILLSHGKVEMCGMPGDVIGRYLELSTKPAENTTGSLAQSSNGKVELVKLDFLNDEGRKTYPVRCGQAVTFRFSFRLLEVLDRGIVSIGIDSASGARVAILTNVLVGHTISLVPPSATVLCRVPDLPLAPGKYSLSIKITDASGVLIWIPNAVDFEVESGDFFKSGKLLTEPWVGFSLIHHAWTTGR